MNYYLISCNGKHQKPLNRWHTHRRRKWLYANEKNSEQHGLRFIDFTHFIMWSRNRTQRSLRAVQSVDIQKIEFLIFRLKSVDRSVVGSNCNIKFAAQRINDRIMWWKNRQRPNNHKWAMLFLSLPCVFSLHEIEIGCERLSIAGTSHTFNLIKRVYARMWQWEYGHRPQRKAYDINISLFERRNTRANMNGIWNWILSCARRTYCIAQYLIVWPWIDRSRFECEFVFVPFCSSSRAVILARLK